MQKKNPKVQCPQCLLYWNQGVICSTCGHLLVGSESSQKFHKLRLDALCIPHYVIKKGRLHGARQGKTEEQKEHFIGFITWKRCRKRVTARKNITKEFTIVFFETKIGWTEQKCIEMIGWHRKITPSVYPEMNSRDIKDSGISH